MLTLDKMFTNDPTTQSTWILQQGFLSEQDTITAVCQLVLSAGFLEATPRPVTSKSEALTPQ